MITVYGYTPAWGLPDISPYVTKLVNYMTFAGLDYTWKPQDLARLDEDSPFGKLPYIVDEDGTKVGDSNRIIIYLKHEYGDPLDGDQSPAEAAQALAFNRLVEEHLYWSGVIQPRWRYEDDFEIYIPYIVQGADVGPELRAALMAFRDRILEEFNGQGMGRRPDDEVLTSVDASVYSTIRHITDSPWDWPGRDYARSQANLVAYTDRIRDEFKI